MRLISTRSRFNVLLFRVLQKEQDNTYLVRVRSVLMLRSIAGVAEGFAAARILAGVRFLAGVGPEVSLQVFQARISLETALKLCPNENDMLIARYVVMRGKISFVL